MDNTAINTSSPPSSPSMMMKDSVMVRRHLLASSNNSSTSSPTSVTSTILNNNAAAVCGLGDLDDLVNCSKLILSASPEDLKQESLSEILAHGEVQELRDWFHRTLAKLQSLERERDYYESKCDALAEVLKQVTVTQSDDDKQETATALIQASSLKVAELSLEVEQLKHQLQQNQSKITLLEQEKEANRAMLVELSSIVQAFSGRDNAAAPTSAPATGLDYSKHGMMVMNRSNHATPSSPDASNAAPESPIITPAMACEMTIRGLKAQVEALEDERGELVSEMVGLQTACDEMRKENEARAVKIAALEKQFHAINQARELVVTQLLKRGKMISNRNLIVDIPTESSSDDCSVASSASSKRSLRWPRVAKPKMSTSSSSSTRD